MIMIINIVIAFVHIADMNFHERVSTYNFETPGATCSIKRTRLKVVNVENKSGLSVSVSESRPGISWKKLIQKEKEKN